MLVYDMCVRIVRLLFLVGVLIVILCNAPGSKQPAIAYKLVQTAGRYSSAVHPAVKAHEGNRQAVRRYLRPGIKGTRLVSTLKLRTYIAGYLYVSRFFACKNPSAGSPILQIVTYITINIEVTLSTQFVVIGQVDMF